MNPKIGYEPGKYWQERLNKDFSLTGVGHSEFSLEYNAWLYRARLYVLRKLLKEKKINCQGKKLLDIGVGTGFYISFWESLGVRDIMGVDISIRSVKELKSKHPNYKFIKADISDENLNINGKFDIITAFDILFHIIKEDSFKQAIGNIKKLSHKDTVVLITDNFLKKYRPARETENDRTLEYYQQILKDYNMEIKDIRPIFYFMNTPIDIERINSKLMRFLVNQIWRVRAKNKGCSKKLGFLGRSISYFWGAILYSLDRLILKHTSLGPSTKLLFAKTSLKSRRI